MTGANNLNGMIWHIKHIDQCFRQYFHSRCRSFLDEHVTICAMLKSIQNQIDRICQSHHESRHVWISQAQRYARADLINKQRNNGTAGRHHVTVASTADNRIIIVTRFGNHYFFHHCFGYTHCIDWINSFIGTQANYALDVILYCRFQYVIRTKHICFHSLHWMEFA
ncbi:hypothetical protein D3C87_1481480 [compost metagenome]